MINKVKDKLKYLHKLVGFLFLNSLITSFNIRLLNDLLCFPAHPSAQKQIKVQLKSEKEEYL